MRTLPIPACGRCKSEYLSQAAQQLPRSTKEAFLTDLRTRARVAVDILSHHISQRKLELLLGLSQGYLSRLRAGVSNPSAELVAHLAMLCQDPPTRLAELERFWALPADSVATASEASDAHRTLPAWLLPAQTERKHAMTDTKNSADAEWMDEIGQPDANRSSQPAAQTDKLHSTAA
jgi:transcriptional regulator with XRE-family HTH domain